MDTLKNKYENDEIFKQDFKQYIERIKDDERILPNLTENCVNTIEYFDGNKNISGIEIIALIYAERNMYYHNGETAKMGMRYPNRQYLIRQYTECFYRHVLMLTSKILEKEIDEIS